MFADGSEFSIEHFKSVEEVEAALELCYSFKEKSLELKAYMEAQIADLNIKLVEVDTQIDDLVNVKDTIKDLDSLA